MKKSDYVIPEFMLVNSKTAEEWLAKNLTLKHGGYQNRKLKEKTHEKYYRKMVRGEWNERNGETIKFDSDGNLIDGQHRLTAQVRAGLDLWWLVAFNCSREAFVTIDEGSNRKTNDVMSMVGEHNANVLASAVTLHLKYTNGTICNASGVSNLEALNALTAETEQDWRDSVMCAVSLKAPKGFLAPSLSAWINYEIKTRHGKEIADAFITAVVRGDGAVSQPVCELRRKLVENIASTRRAPRICVSAWLVKTWNAHYQKQHIGKGGLRFRHHATRDATGKAIYPPETFPTIL